MTLKDFISGAARRRVYFVFALVGVVLGAVQVGFGAADAGQPVWLTVALAVFAFLSGAVGFTARANTDKADPAPAGPVLTPAAGFPVPGEHEPTAANPARYEPHGKHAVNVERTE